MAQRYGKRPSEILKIKDEQTAFDFDAAIMIKADKIRSGEIKDTKTTKKEQSQQIAAVKALQAKVNQMKGIGNV